MLRSPAPSANFRNKLNSMQSPLNKLIGNVKTIVQNKLPKM